VNQRVGDQKNTAQLCEPQSEQTNKERERERERDGGGGAWRPEKVKEIVMVLLLITTHNYFLI
jgi:hypothetical protein